MTSESFLIKSIADGVALLQLDRPEARNALSEEMRAQLIATLAECDSDAEVRAIVIAGNDEYFAAGADIKALRDRTLADNLGGGGAATLWQALAACKTPVIAAVSGFALGGGCELALACDMIIASDTAEFGQPEITLGIIPGGGGTQRLARVMGKQKAMELVLTGKRISAQEAEQLGIVNRVVADNDWLQEALSLGGVIARRPALAVRLGKQAVNAAEEMPMAAALDYERRLFELAMATEDRVEGMTAFLEKRKPNFTGK